MKVDRGYIPKRALLYFCNENSGHLHFCLQPRAAHALRSDQLPKIVATFVSASIQGQRTPSARTKIVAYLSLLRWRTHFARTNSGHLRFCLQPRAAHALRLDQKKKKKIIPFPWILCLYVYCTWFNLFIVNTGSFMVLCYLNMWQQVLHPVA